MEQFVVSARKYRPQTFDSVVDQEIIVTTLKNAILRGQLAHAYLFCGPRGVGKTTCARIFAKTINCLNPTPRMEACGVCESCRSFEENRSYCIHELDAASNNSVDDIRELIDKVHILPQVGKYSVYIIDEVHMLSQAAFNAFLKTLEEPPAYAIFILATTEKHKVLPTILSRCQSFDFNRISIKATVNYLASVAEKEGVEAEREALHVIAMRADGAMRDALTLLDQCIAICGKQVTYAQALANLNVLDFEYYFRLINWALEGNYHQMLCLFDQILGKGFNALHFIAGLSSHLRNLLVSLQPEAADLLDYGPETAAKYSAQAAACGPAFIIKALQTCATAEIHYKDSTNPRLHIELALVNLSQLAAPVAPPAVESVVRPTLPAAGLPVQKPVTGLTAEKPVTGTPVTEKPVAEVPVVGKPVAQNPVAEKPVAEKPVAEKPVVEKPVAPQLAPQPAPAAPLLQATKVQEVKNLSIKELLKQTAAAPKAEAQALSQEEKDFTQAELEQVWNDLAQLYKDRPNLFTALTYHKPRLEADGQVLLDVNNQAQKTWMEKNFREKGELYLRKHLSNGRLRLGFEILKVQEEEKKASLLQPEEKARFLMEQNPELKTLYKELSLDIS